MAELELTDKENTAVDRIDAQLAGVSGRVTTLVEAEGGVDNLCEPYRKIRPFLPVLIGIVRKIPKVGETIAKVLELLMGIADAVCPA